MAAELTRLTHKMATQLNLVAESCTISSSRSTRPVRKLFDTPSYMGEIIIHVSYPFRYMISIKQIPTTLNLTDRNFNTEFLDTTLLMVLVSFLTHKFARTP
jgi:hypothetical protein